MAVKTDLLQNKQIGQKFTNNQLKHALRQKKPNNWCLCVLQIRRWERRTYTRGNKDSLFRWESERKLCEQDDSINKQFIPISPLQQIRTAARNKDSAEIAQSFPDDSTQLQITPIRRKQKIKKN
jgi:hypothetical protein